MPDHGPAVDWDEYTARTSWPSAYQLSRAHQGGVEDLGGQLQSRDSDSHREAVQSVTRRRCASAGEGLPVRGRRTATKQEAHLLAQEPDSLTEDAKYFGGESSS